VSETLSGESYLTREATGADFSVFNPTMVQTTDLPHYKRK